LGLTLDVSVKPSEFILSGVIQCKCKNQYIYMVLHDYVKQSKHKINTSIWFYMVVNVKKCIHFLGGKGNFIMFLVIGQSNSPLQKNKPITTCTHN
jgi:hypothetical protein